MQNAQKHTTDNIQHNVEELKSVLIELQDTYGTYIDQENLKLEMNFLLKWLDNYSGSSGEDKKKVQKNGMLLLDKIHEKFALAAEDIMRIDAESPTSAENHTGGKSHKLNRAGDLALQAKKLLLELFEKEFLLKS